MKNHVFKKFRKYSENKLVQYDHKIKPKTY